MTVYLFAAKPPLLRPIWQERFLEPIFRAKAGIFPVTKSSKPVVWAFPKRAGIDTYASHPLALARVAFSGSPLETVRSARLRLARFRFRSA